MLKTLDPEKIKETSTLPPQIDSKILDPVTKQFNSIRASLNYFKKILDRIIPPWYLVNRALALDSFCEAFRKPMTSTKKESTTANQSEVFPNHLIAVSTKNVPLVESKHRQIVDGACRIFFRKGYHPTTIREIAKSCGMSMGQLYHYISSKDDVLYLVHRHMQKVWYEYLKKSNLEQIEDPLQKLIKALHCNLQFIIENRKLIQFIYTESKYLDKKHLRIVLEMDYNNVIGFWRSLLREIKKPKSIKGDLDFLASLIAYLVVFLPLRGWTLRDRATRKNVDSSVDFILRGLGVMK